MAILEDRTLREAIESAHLSVDPFDPSLIQANSLDVRLGNTECHYIPSGYNRNIINPADEAPRSVSRQVDRVVIHPGDFILVDTMEYFKLPSDIYGIVMGKSSIGRLGLDVENAGLIDSGFEGSITLELSNKNPLYTFVLSPGYPIAQIVFDSCEEVETPYNLRTTSRYNGQRGATPFRVNSNDSIIQGTQHETDGTPSSIAGIIDHFSPGKRRKR
jgi:dCTP deaminase